jgi:hypothetical protein
MFNVFPNVLCVYKPFPAIYTIFLGPFREVLLYFIKLIFVQSGTVISYLGILLLLMNPQHLFSLSSSLFAL